jgi:hypothetical protein
MNQAQAERSAAQMEINNAPAKTEVSRAEVYAMIDSLGDIGGVIEDAEPAGRGRLYQKLGLELRYVHDGCSVLRQSLFGRSHVSGRDWLVGVRGQLFEVRGCGLVMGKPPVCGSCLFGERGGAGGGVQQYEGCGGRR